MSSPSDKVEHAQRLIRSFIAQQPEHKRSDRAVGRSLGIHNTTVKNLRKGAGSRVSGSVLALLERLTAPELEANPLSPQESATSSTALPLATRTHLIQDLRRLASLPNAHSDEYRSAWHQWHRLAPAMPDFSDLQSCRLWGQRLLWLLASHDTAAHPHESQPASASAKE